VIFDLSKSKKIGSNETAGSGAGGGTSSFTSGGGATVSAGSAAACFFWQGQAHPEKTSPKNSGRINKKNNFFIRFPPFI
jgi:hypothetical protein